jgi:hypothetical protein
MISGKEQGEDQKEGIFPKVERNKPGNFPASGDSSSTGRKNGPGVTYEAEIREVLGNESAKATRDSCCFPSP